MNMGIGLVARAFAHPVVHNHVLLPNARAPQILGGDKRSQRNAIQSTEIDMVVDHIILIRKQPWGRNMPIVVIIEGNLNKVAMRNIAAFLEGRTPRELQPVECLRTAMKVNGEVEPFVWVDGHDSKERLQLFMNNLLVQRGVSILDGFLAPNGADHAARVKQAMETQLRNMRITTRTVGKDGFQTTHMTVSGKGGGQQDDVAMSLMLGTFWGAMHEMWLAIDARADYLRTIENPDNVLRYKTSIDRLRARSGQRMGFARWA